MSPRTLVAAGRIPSKLEEYAGLVSRLAAARQNQKDHPSHHNEIQGVYAEVALEEFLDKNPSLAE